MSRADEMGASGKPVIVLSNHVNYLDVPVYMASMPWFSHVRYARTFYSSYLDEKIPGFRFVSRGCRNIPVYFKESGTEGGFHTDPDRAHETEAILDENLGDGCILTYYPEGKMNKTPRQLLSFRYGGFKKLVEVDAEVWCAVHAGNADCWPRGETFGGRPARLLVTVQPLAPDGVGALLETLGGAEEPHVVLAKHCEARMQQLLTELYVNLDGAAAEPLLDATRDASD